MPPQIPYPITGLVYDVDGSTVIVSQEVEFYNLRNGQKTTDLTDSNGRYIIDLANMDGIYQDGDEILIRASRCDGEVFKLKEATITVDTSVGNTTQNLTLVNEIPEQPRNIDHKQIIRKVYDPVANAFKMISVDSAGNQIKTIRQRENLAGSAGSGSDGDSNRVFTLTTTNDVDIVEVYLDGVLLVETTQYTIDNTAKTVTMVSTAVFDSQILSVFYNV